MQVGQVEEGANEVALRFIIALITVVIDDDIVAIVFSRRDVLEVVEIERVAEDVVAVAALKRLLFSHRRVVEHVELLVAEHRHSKFARVLLFRLGPLAIFLGQTSPVSVETFIELDVANSEGWEALFNGLCDRAAEEVDQEEEHQGAKHGPVVAVPARILDDRVDGVATLGNGVCSGAWVKMLVAKELQAGRHPVTE